MPDILPTDVQLRRFVNDLNASVDFDPEPFEGCENIILCGMGGSAISGDVVSDCCFTGSQVPIRVVKFPRIPRWAGPSTLAVLSSYSGNTIETVEMYNDARKAGCKICVITSGGIMRRKAEENGDILILLPDDMHPRHSVGLMIGYTLSLVRAAGGPDLSDEIHAIVPGLREFRASMEDRSESGLAWRMAGRFLETVPVICADSSMKSVVLRWKTQINENSKHVAFCGTLPDSKACIDESVDLYGKENLLLTLLSGTDDAMCTGTSFVEDLASELYEGGREFEYVKLDGSSTLDNLFRALILGDYISLYMAEMREIDSAEVKPIRRLKSKIRSMPSNTEGAS